MHLLFEEAFRYHVKPDHKQFHFLFFLYQENEKEKQPNYIKELYFLFYKLFILWNYLCGLGTLTVESPVREFNSNLQS